MVQLHGLSPFLMGFHQSFDGFWQKSMKFQQVSPAFFSIFTGFPRFSLVFPGPPWVPLKVHRSPRQAEEALQDAVQKTLGPGPWDAQNHLTSAA